MKTQATPKMMVLHAPVGVRSIVSFLVAFFIIASSIVFLFDRGQEAQVQMVVEHGRQEVKMKVEAGLQEPAIGGTTDEAGDTSKEECTWSRGQWVYDNVSRPLYSGLECTFIFPEVACDKYGRKDVMYQHWRWQPHGCDLPRFDAIKLLEKLMASSRRASSMARSSPSRHWYVSTGKYNNPSRWRILTSSPPLSSLDRLRSLAPAMSARCSRSASQFSAVLLPSISCLFFACPRSTPILESTDVQCLLCVDRMLFFSSS